MRMIEALIAAAYRKNISEFDSLIAAGADINETDEDGRTPLVHAVLDSKPDPEFIRHLLEEGADANIPDAAQRWTALHFAAQAGNGDIVDLLINAGAKVDAHDVFGNTPLWRAVMTPQPDGATVATLLIAGADPTKRNQHGVSARDITKKRGMTELEQILHAR